jgi:hypothetical protein
MDNLQCLISNFKVKFNVSMWNKFLRENCYLWYYIMIYVDFYSLKFKNIYWGKELRVKLRLSFKANNNHNVSGCHLRKRLSPGFMVL